jgi:hypothetical protein
MIDEAAKRVLLYLWGLEAPPTAFKKNFHQMTSNDLMQQGNLHALRGVVLRVWRAFSSPDARPDPFGPQETSSSIARREATVLRMVGLKMKSGILFPADANLSTLTKISSSADVFKLGGIDVNALHIRSDSQPGVLGMLPLREHLYSPFSTQELLADSHDRAEF